MIAPTLFTSHWRSDPLLHLDVVPVGISRGTPRHRLPFKYRVLRLLAPSRQTFDLADDEAFEQAYIAELEEVGVERIREALRKISAEEGGKSLALLCFESDSADCHRGVFAAWWEERTGQEVHELRPGVLGLRGQPEQSRLFE